MTRALSFLIFFFLCLSATQAADWAVSSRIVETMTIWSAAVTAASQLDARMLLPVSTTIMR